jgi:undecaprenyl-diphosphatase
MAFDLTLFHMLNNLAGQTPLGDKLIVFCGSYLAYILIALFLAVVIASKDRWKDKIYFFIVTGLSTLIARFGVTELIRFFYHRPRPFLVEQPVHQLLTDTSWSFPSGHATFFFALATIVYLHNRKWGAFFFIAAIVVSFGRVAAGVHYPSDIAGGAVVGIVTTYLVYIIFNAVNAPKPNQST